MPWNSLLYMAQTASAENTSIKKEIDIEITSSISSPIKIILALFTKSTFFW